MHRKAKINQEAKFFRPNILVASFLLAIAIQLSMLAVSNFYESYDPVYGYASTEPIFRILWPCFNLIPDGLMSQCSFATFSKNIIILLGIFNLGYFFLPTISLMALIYFVLSKTIIVYRNENGI